MSANKIIAKHVREHELPENDFKGWGAPGLLAQKPVIGLMMFIWGGLVFGGLVLNLLYHEPLLEWDILIANTLPAAALKSPPFVRILMDTGFYIGDQVIAVSSILLGIFFIIKHYWQEFAMLAVGLVGASSLFLSLTALFDRARPATQIWMIVNLPGFPSGHAISSVTFYGLLAYLFVPKMTSKLWKVVATAAVLLIIIFIGFSRVFTGGHFLTDILAGYAVGIAWSGAIFTLIEVISQKIRRRDVKNG